jgi:hypothetical protein
MKRKTIYFAFFLALFSCSNTSKNKTEKLFNGKDLKNWEFFVGNQLNGWKGEPVEKTANQIFSIIDFEGKPAIHVSGDINASICTKKSYKNYHLKLRFKYGNKIYTRQNSGLLYHSYGDFGVGLKTWKSSHELQLLTENIGGSYRMGNTYMKVPAVQNEKKWKYEKGTNVIPTGKQEKTSYISEDLDHEKIGDWNIVELYCFDRTSIHVVNGKVNCVNYESGKYVDGKIVPLNEGFIQIQSEGGEFYISDIELNPITELPKKLLQ